MNHSPALPPPALPPSALSPPAPPPRLVDVCICTYRRPSVGLAIASVAAQVLPTGVRVRVVVADNDDTASAETMVRQAAIALGIDLAYVHAPARNISVARNACLDAAQGDWIAFLDDDEEAAPGWLAALLTCAQTESADAVFGPALAIYPRHAPRWMVENDFHSNIPKARQGRVETGHSCNALIRRASLPVALRFLPELGRSGGEDTDFFFRLGRAGARLAICPSAQVTETVPPHRLRLIWLAERRFAEGRHYARAAGKTADQTAAKTVGTMSGQDRTRLALAGLAKAGISLCLVLPMIIIPHRAMFWAMRGMFHAGVVSGAVAPDRMGRTAYGG